MERIICEKLIVYFLQSFENRITKIAQSDDHRRRCNSFTTKVLTFANIPGRLVDYLTSRHLLGKHFFLQFQLVFHKPTCFHNPILSRRKKSTNERSGFEDFSTQNRLLNFVQLNYPLLKFYRFIKKFGYFGINVTSLIH